MTDMELFFFMFYIFDYSYYRYVCMYIAVFLYVSVSPFDAIITIRNPEKSLWIHESSLSGNEKKFVEYMSLKREVKEWKIDGLWNRREWNELACVKWDESKEDWLERGCMTKQIRKFSPFETNEKTCGPNGRHDMRSSVEISWPWHVAVLHPQSLTFLWL